ncbi:MAG: hypothetical protein LBM04_02680 [Opitutaceae bacterium]|jgi:hypothetical protein|nr:hypothetical protein [Opitutaceae bacterium]
MPDRKSSKTPTATTPPVPAPAPVSAPRAPCPGDIYVQRSADTGRYCAYQIIHAGNTSPRSPGKDISLLSLDWVGDTLPTDADLAAMRPLNNTRYYWGHSLDYRMVIPPRLPASFIYIANRPPLITKKTNSFGGWPAPRKQSAEHEADWRARDPERLRRFNAAHGSGREFILAPGYTARDTHTRAGPELLDRLANLADLDKLPRLLEIEARGPRPDLIAYLRTHDLLYRLIWREHGRCELDFRDIPHIEEIELDATGLETLHLHKALRTLKLTGTLHPRIRIHAHDGGSQLHLETPPAIAGAGHADPGLPKLATLRIAGIDCLDLATIVARHPALEVLSLAGKPGALQNLSAIARLPRIRSLCLDDLFGFTPADIPPPGTHPHLASLSLESIPADVAAHVKKVYAPLKKTANLDLEVRKPRAPGWLAENLDNPFRAWDGSEFVTPANARRAAALYKKTHAALRARLDAHDAPVMLPAYLEALVREWTATFNAWDKRTAWIETEERETICEVVENFLIEAARRHPAANINIPALTALFDDLRDF